MQLVLFPVVPPNAIYRSCIHGIPVTWTVGECPQCQTDPGDAPKSTKTISREGGSTGSATAALPRQPFSGLGE